MAVTIPAAIAVDAPSAAVGPARSVGYRLTFLTGEFSFSDEYPTGGEQFDISQYFGKQLLGVIFEPKGGYMFEYDYANKRVKAIHPRAAIANTLTVTTPELAHAQGETPVTSSAETMPAHAPAACTVSGVAGVAAGPGAEVPNETNLSSLTGIRWLAWGL